MRNTNKKGFTIVELVIVVAVIAILAAVLIPTFSGIIKQANIASDKAIAKNLNNALTVAAAEGKEIKEFADALEAIHAAGYVVANLNPTTANYYYAWEKNSNQIILVNGADWSVVYQSKDFVNKADSTIAGGTWHIALTDTSVLDGVSGAVVIPTITAASVNGDAGKITTLFKNNNTIVLNESVELTKAPVHSDGVKADGIRLTAPSVLDLNGQTLSATFTTDNYRIFQIDKDFNLSNGTIVSVGDGKKGGLWGVLRTFGGANVSIKNMQISYTDTYQRTGSEVPGAILSITERTNLLIEDTVFYGANTVGMEISNSTATLKNVSFKGIGDEGWLTAGIEVSGNGKIIIESGKYEAQGDILYVLPSGGTIEVKGGTFIGGLSVHDVMYDGCEGNIVISGGTFSVNPTEYLADGYVANQNADGMWVVTAK